VSEARADAAAPDPPMPPRDWLGEHTAPSKGSAGRGWQTGWRAGYLAGLQAAAAGEPAFDKVRSPAAVAKLYVLAVAEEMAVAVAAAKAKYVADLSGDAPFSLLIASEKYLRATGRGAVDPQPKED